MIVDSSYQVMDDSSETLDRNIFSCKSLNIYIFPFSERKGYRLAKKTLKVCLSKPIRC